METNGLPTPDNVIFGEIILSQIQPHPVMGILIASNTKHIDDLKA